MRRLRCIDLTIVGFLFVLTCLSDTGHCVFQILFFCHFHEIIFIVSSFVKSSFVHLVAQALLDLLLETEHVLCILLFNDLKEFLVFLYLDFFLNIVGYDGGRSLLGCTCSRANKTSYVQNR